MTKSITGESSFRRTFLAVGLAAMVGSLMWASVASARTVESVSVTPTLQVDANAAAVQGSPGSNVPLAISVNNSGSEIGLTGEFGYSGGLFTNSVVKSWYAVIEYQPTGGSWTPLAGIQRVASGYSPASSAPITTGLSATVVPQARFGVTYPSSGDRVVGTQVAGLSTAQWNLDLRSSQAAAKIVQLLSSSQTSQIRVRTRIESRVTGLFGIQYTDAQTRTATFTRMLRSQSATASDVRVTVTGDGNTQQFTSANSPTLASLGAAQSVALSASVAMPSVQPKQAGESDGEYLNRLRAAAEQSVTAVTTTSHKAGGVATPYWWWIGENDPGYDIGSLRTITQPASSDTVGVALPIMEIAKQGPPTIDAGTTANYGIDVANTGDASGTATVTDEVDGTAPAAVGGFGSIASGQTASGNHAVDVPANFQSTQLHDRASVTWLDNAGNGYGPVAADVTTTVILDTVPPEAPQLTAAPPALTNSPSATFEFAGEPSGVFKCVIDGAPAGDCLAPVVLGDLNDGAHTFSIWQVDDAGNVGSAIAYAWTVDTTPPAVPQLSGAPSIPTSSVSANVSFTGEPGGSFECDVDSGGWAPCAAPIEMSALADGLHTVDVRQTDAAGNTGGGAHAEWVVDTEAPATPLLNSTPAMSTQDTTAGFGFAGEPGGSFDCRLDSASFAPCANPKSYEDLLEGDHTFAVRQTDDAGNVGEIAAFSWTIDHTAPGAPSITSAPSSPTNQTSASFEFAGEPSGTIECKLDGGEFVACASPSTYAGLTDGTHTFSVRQTDDAGNVGSATTHTWQVDNTPPAAPTIDSAPAATIDTDSATFAFSGEPGAGFECRFDGGSFAACDSPKVYADLTAGAHTFAVRQIDVAGNVSAEASASFTVQLFGTNVGVAASTLTVASDPGSQNTITVSKSGAIYTVTDSTSQITAAPGCTTQDAHTVTCADVTVNAMEPGIYAATGDSYLLADGEPGGDPQITEIVASTGDLDDSITIEGSVTVPATIDGGDGNDQLTGGPQQDTILGGDGADQIESVDSQIDQTSCGAGVDSAHTDTTDVTDGCETVSVPTTVARVESFPAIPGFEAIEYRAAPGENNNVSLAIAGSTVTYSDSALEIVAGPGCSQVTPQSVACDFTGLTVAYTFLKDGDDSFAADPVSDALSNGAYGGEGDDVLHGGPGMDGFDGGPGADTITGADGFDSVVYTYRDLDINNQIERDEGVEIRLDGEPNDGAPYEGDDVGSDIEWVIGTNHGDTLTASENDAVISGFAGDDVLIGGPGADRLHGNEGDDVLDGGLGTDYIDGYEGLDTFDYSSRSASVYVNWSPGHPGNGEDGENDDVRGVEKIVGGAGDDFLRGTSQADVIEGGPGEDTVDALEGADDIKVRDGELDHVQCGVDTEADTVKADAIDDVQSECDGNDVVDRPPTNVNVSGSELAITLDDATKNTLEVTRAHGQYILANTSGGLVAGAGCQQRAAAEVVCQVEGVTSASVATGDQGDSVKIGKRVTIPTTLNGGAGADVFVGGSGNDNLTGSSGDDELDGRAGTDAFDGSSGADALVSSDGEADTITCDSNDISVTVDRLDAAQGCDSPEIVSVAAFVTLDFGMPLPLFVYYAAPGQQNDVVSVVTTRTARFTDSESGIVAGSGCTQVDEYRVDCLGQDSLGALVYLGDGYDQALSRGSTAVTVVSAGEAGDDELRGGAGTAVLDGGPGNDRLFGGDGDDNLVGGDGDDMLDGGSGADIADGGAGDDTMDYSSRTEDVTISITDGSGDNGEIGEHDITAAGIENVAGGGGDDQLLGNDLANRIDGGPGEDTIDGLGGDDAVLVRDGVEDHVQCSDGTDSVTADTLDAIDPTCQTVDRDAKLNLTSGSSNGGATNDPTPEFAFLVDAAEATFECEVNGGGWNVCTSPFTTTDFLDGTHTFAVRAVGVNSAVVAGPEERSFTVDTVAPDVSIVAGPEEGETIGDTSPSFEFGSGDPTATFECRLDEGSFRHCEPSYALNLLPGSFELSVRSVDLARNRSAEVTRGFTVSSSAIVEFTAAPESGEQFDDTSPTFEFDAPDPAGPVTFECAIDGGSYFPCRSPYIFSSTYAGRRSFAVRARDIFGKAGPTVSRTVVFTSGDPPDDLNPPSTLLIDGPDDGSTVTKPPVFEFSANEAAEFLCRLDDEDWRRCETPWHLAALSHGVHRVEIGAEDTSGNFTDATVTREFSYEPDPESDATLPSPANRTNGLEQSVDFDLGIYVAQVSIKTGELLLTTDDSVPTATGGTKIALSRFYRSMAQPASAGLGDRWSLSVGPDVYLAVQPSADSVELHGPGGCIATFWRDPGERTFTGPETLNASLKLDNEGRYLLTRPLDRDTLVFSEEGKLVWTINSVGDMAAVSNTSAGGIPVLESYGYGSSDQIDAQYDADGELEHLVHPSFAVAYQHDTIGQLVSATVSGSTTNYAYNANGMINQVELPNQTVVTFDIDSEGVTRAVTTTPVGGPSQTTSFAYALNQTTVTRPNGESHAYRIDLESPSYANLALRDQMSNAYAAQFDTTPVAADSAVEAQLRTSGLADALNESLDTDFAGLWYDEADGGRVKVQVAAGGPLAAAFEIVNSFDAQDITDVYHVSYAIDELNEVADQLEVDLEPLIDASLVDVTVDEKLDRVVVATRNDITSSQLQDVTIAIDGAAGRAVISEGEKPVDPDEQRVETCTYGDTDESSNVFTGCGPPIQGAVGIGLRRVPDFGGVCSAGFVGRAYDQYAILTAGHCVDGERKWTARPRDAAPGDYRYLGVSNEAFENGVPKPSRTVRGDAGSIAISRTGLWAVRSRAEISASVAYMDPITHPYLDPSAPNQYGARIPIFDVVNAGRGTQVCTGGAHSGFHCGTVIKTGYTADYGNSWTRGLAVVRLPVMKDIYGNDICSTVGGDSGGPIVTAAGIAYGILSGGREWDSSERFCYDYYQPLLQNKGSHNKKKYDGALRIARFGIYLQGRKKPHYWYSNRKRSRKPRVSQDVATASTNGQPSFYVTPRGAETKYSFQISTAADGSAIAFEAPTVTIGDDYTPVQIPGSAYASCIFEEGGRYIRVVARNANGVSATEWIHLAKNCDVGMVDAPSTSLSGGRSSNAVGRGGTAVWIVDSSTSRGAFDLPPNVDLRLRVGYETCDQNRDTVGHWVAWGFVLSGQIFNCRFVPQCHQQYCGDAELDPTYGMADDGAVSTYELSAGMTFADVVSAISNKTLDIGNPDHECSDGESHFRHIVTPVYMFNATNTSYAGPPLVKRGTPGFGDYPSYICR